MLFSLYILQIIVDILVMHILNWQKVTVLWHCCGTPVLGSSLGWAHGIKILGKFSTPMFLCHQAV